MLASCICCSFFYFCSPWSCGSSKLHLKFYCPSMSVCMYVCVLQERIFILSQYLSFNGYMYILAIYSSVYFFLWILPVHQGFNNILRHLFCISSLLLITAPFLDTICISNWIYSYIFSVFFINLAIGIPLFPLLLFFIDLTFSSVYLQNYTCFII